MDARTILRNGFLNVSLVCSSLHLESGNGTKRQVLTLAGEVTVAAKKKRNYWGLFFCHLKAECCRDTLV